ncbi:MAG: hypothetical protein GY794_11805, partial [bacterium]|nr:hypothetical protein [bacterium]
MAKNKRIKAQELSDSEIAQLRRELAAEAIRRQVNSDALTMDAAEEAGEKDQEVTRGALEDVFASIDEDGLPKRCPRCGRKTPVHTYAREKRFTTTRGEVTIKRNYHYCRRCKHGFYPLDRELDLPAEGKATHGLSKRILDLAITDSFEATEQRWSVHYPFSISANLARLVVDRVGSECESSDDDYLQHALRKMNGSKSDLAVVQSDGSMVPTRDGGWKEVKVGMVFRAENHLSNRESTRGQITEARFVAVLGGQEEFKARLDSAIRAECTKPKMTLWMGDGALGNWRLARELVPAHRVDILDWKHALNHSHDCAKILLDSFESLVEDWQQCVTYMLRYHEPGDVISELKQCLDFVETAEEVAAVEDLVRYYGNNETRMRYRY